MKTTAQALDDTRASASEPLAELLDTCLCLAKVAELLQEEDIEDEQLALRMQQYAACASGTYCPEVAFDPVARGLRAIAMRYQGSAAFAAWVTHVRSRLTELYLQRREPPAMSMAQRAA